MRLIATLLLCIGCATTRTDQPPTTPAAPVSEGEREAAELDASLASPPLAVTEPTPSEPLWTGYMVVKTDSVPPGVAILFPEDGVITDQTLAEGVRLNAATANSNNAYWLFPVPRGALFFHSVRVYDDGSVAVEMPLQGQYEGTTVIVAAVILDDPSGATTYRPCVHDVCGCLRKAALNRTVGCEGPRCADLTSPTP